MNECPAPGIYRSVQFATYLEWDAISNSRMQPALRSMAHYKDHPAIEETPAMRLGTLTHTGRFEPQRVGSQYVVMPAYEDQVRKPDGSKYDKPKSSGAYRELVDEFKRNTDREIVTSQQYADMLGMVSALNQDERATGFLTGGDYEVSIVARDPVTGLLCKGRIDHLHVRGRRIGDLKTALDASRFENVIADRSYHRQLAFYSDILSWLDEPIAIDECSIVCVENTSPYCVRSAPLSEDAMDEGRDEYRRLLNAIAKSVKSKRWPGYENPDSWRLPAWKVRASGPVSVVVGGERIAVG